MVISEDDSSVERLSKIRFVLVGTTHPGNIGASARAMKAMGLRDLALVDPKIFPSAEATARASGADDLLAAATIHKTLADAISDCTLVLGTTARDRHLSWPIATPEQAAIRIRDNGDRAAVIFGREQSGLSNEELDLCHTAIRIPTAPEFSSLNLSQAVQICAYEIRKALDVDSGVSIHPHEDDHIAGADSLERLFQHLMASMTQVGYFDPEKPKLLERRVRRMLNRAALRASEVQILRGFLAAVDQRIWRDHSSDQSDTSEI